jgi:hypothetical protein
MKLNGLSARLDRLESRLKTLVEGSLSGLFPEKGIRGILIGQMISVMKAATQDQEIDSSLAPDVYVLLVNPDTLLEMEIDPSLMDELAQIIKEAGEGAGLEFVNTPVITISPNSDVKKGSISVVARNSRLPLLETVKTTIQVDNGMENIPMDAFLIVNGDWIYSLDQSVINIGRRSTNDLIIDDVRVSRDHAQLRAIRGKFVLFDLNSTGGTFINGKRITKRTLSPRDVISLAGLPLIYSQGSGYTTNLGQTQKMRTSDDEDSTKVDRVL